MFLFPQLQVCLYFYFVNNCEMNGDQVAFYLTWSVLFIKKKLHGLSPRANYTDRATAACRRSECQLLRIECATWSA
jgi:hypothetical protein